MGQDGRVSVWNKSDKGLLRFGSILSYVLAGFTLLTFAFAMIAIPISGANVPGEGIAYPYLNTIQQYPRDFIWQYFAIILMGIYIVHYAVMRLLIDKSKRIFLDIGLIFVSISGAILMVDYYIQLNVIPISLMAKETDGLALLIQYNPHGIFIAMEELGYELLLVSMLCMVPVFWQKKQRLFSILNVSGLLVTISAYVYITLQFGLNKMDRFEIVLISVVWLLTIYNGISIGNKMRKEIRSVHSVRSLQ